MKQYTITTTKTGFNSRKRKSETIGAMLYDRSGDVVDYIQVGEDNHKAALSWGEWRAESINEEYAGQVAKMVIYCGDVEVAFIEIEEQQEKVSASELDERIESALKEKSFNRNSKACKVLQELTGMHTELIYGRIEPLKTYMVYGGVIRPVRTSGSGRFTKNMDYTADICRALDACGIKYETGNDAPRGGACGTFIKVLTKIEKEA